MNVPRSKRHGVCLAGNFGACDGEAVVLILDLLNQSMQLGLEQWYTQDDYAELQAMNNELHARLETQLQTFAQDIQHMHNEIETAKINQLKLIQEITDKDDAITMQDNEIEEKDAEIQKLKKDIAALEQKNTKLQEKTKYLDTALSEQWKKLVYFMDENEKNRHKLYDLEMQKMTDVLPGKTSNTQACVVDWNTAFAKHYSH